MPISSVSSHPVSSRVDFTQPGNNEQHVKLTVTLFDMLSEVIEHLPSQTFNMKSLESRGYILKQKRIQKRGYLVLENYLKSCGKANELRCWVQDKDNIEFEFRTHTGKCFSGRVVDSKNQLWSGAVRFASGNTYEGRWKGNKPTGRITCIPRILLENVKLSPLTAEMFLYTKIDDEINDELGNEKLDSLFFDHGPYFLKCLSQVSAAIGGGGRESRVVRCIDLFKGAIQCSESLYLKNTSRLTDLYQDKSHVLFPLIIHTSSNKAESEKHCVMLYIDKQNNEFSIVNTGRGLERHGQELEKSIFVKTFKIAKKEDLDQFIENYNSTMLLDDFYQQLESCGRAQKSKLIESAFEQAGPTCSFSCGLAFLRFFLPKKTFVHFIKQFCQSPEMPRTRQLKQKMQEFGVWPENNKSNTGSSGSRRGAYNCVSRKQLAYMKRDMINTD